MSTLAAAPVPFIAAITVVALVLLAVIARAVFAPTNEPARRLCAILATLRRPRSGIDACRLLLPPSPCPPPGSPEPSLATAAGKAGRPPGPEPDDVIVPTPPAMPSPRTAKDDSIVADTIALVATGPASSTPPGVTRQSGTRCA